MIPDAISNFFLLSAHEYYLQRHLMPQSPEQKHTFNLYTYTGRSSIDFYGFHKEMGTEGLSFRNHKTVVV